MTASDIIAKAQKYLCSDDTQVRFISCNNAAVLNDIKQQLCIGDVRVIEAHLFSKKDELPDIGSIINEIQNARTPIVLSGFFTAWKLLGETQLTNFMSQLVQFSKLPCRTAVLCHQPGKMLDFPDDPRCSRLVWHVDGESDAKPELQFVAPDMPEFLKCSYIDGVNMISKVVESGDVPGMIAVRTHKLKSSFPCSMLPINEQTNAFEALSEIDSLTAQLKPAYGKQEQWQTALNEISGAGSWEKHIDSAIGRTDDLGAQFRKFQTGDEYTKWLYFIGIKLFGAGKNNCLKLAAERSENASQLVREIYRSILSLDSATKEFPLFYSERKALLADLTDSDDEAADFCSILRAEKSNPLPYLTDCTRIEQETVIKVLADEGTQNNKQETEATLKFVFPKLYSYMQPYNFGNQTLNDYFSQYKYQKLINRIFPEFEQTVAEQAELREHNIILKPRSEVVEKLDKTNSCLYFVDAMGVEYLGYIMQKCAEMKLAADIQVCRCELPSLTFCNKDFVESFEQSGATVYSIKKLDEIKHHGEENFDYTQNKYPTHLIKELDIIAEVLNSARTNLKNGTYSKAYIISDHGASRLAVIKEHTLNIDVNSKGTHSGRVCAYTDDVSQIPCATVAGDYYVIANYDRFKGGRAANVEVHGGATLEELTVPVICLTIAPENIEITMLTPEITISFRKKAEVRFFSNTRLNDASLLVDGNYYSAEYDGNAYIVKMPDIKKARAYSADVYSGNTCIAHGISFTVKKEGASEKEFF